MTKMSPAKEVKSRELARIRFFTMVPDNAMSKGNAKCLQKAPRHGGRLHEKIAWGMGGVKHGWEMEPGPGGETLPLRFMNHGTLPGVSPFKSRFEYPSSNASLLFAGLYKEKSKDK